MVQLQDKQCIERTKPNLPIVALSLQPTYIQQARVEAAKLQIADNWTEILNQLNTFSTEFRFLVWHFWELDVFGESDFIVYSAEISTLLHPKSSH